MDWQTGARDPGVAARKCPEMEHCEIHRLAVHTSCLSQGQKCVQVNTHIYTHAHGHQSLAYRKRYPTREKNWIRKYGHRDLWESSFVAGREIQLGAHFIFKREPRGRSICVVYLKPHLVTMGWFEIFIYMYDKIRPIMLLSRRGFSEWIEWKPITQRKLWSQDTWHKPIDDREEEYYCSLISIMATHVL